MQRNTETIEQIQAKTKLAIANDPLVKDLEKFNLKDVVIDNSMSLGKMTFSEDAVKKVLGILNVKPEFTEYRKSMSEKDWELVADKIKKAKGEVFLYGEVAGSDFVRNVHYANPKKKKSDDMTGSLAIINSIEDELRESESDFSLAGFSFDPETYLFDIELKNETSGVDALKGDEWKTGERFMFNSANFNYYPYFERLVCSNGMLAKDYRFRSSIGKTSFNNDRIEKVIYNSLHSLNASHLQIIEERAQYLQKTNISIAEFYSYRNWLNKGQRKDNYIDVINKYFPEDAFYKAYALPVSEQSKSWKSTADSGINAYNFLNLLTWIASHPEVTNLSKTDALDLKIVASELFFWDKFHMREVAPKVKVDYPILQEMQ